MYGVGMRAAALQATPHLPLLGKFAGVKWIGVCLVRSQRLAITGDEVSVAARRHLNNILHRHVVEDPQSGLEMETARSALAVKRIA